MTSGLGSRATYLHILPEAQGSHAHSGWHFRCCSFMLTGPDIHARAANVSMRSEVTVCSSMRHRCAVCAYRMACLTTTSFSSDVVTTDGTCLNPSCLYHLHTSASPGTPCAAPYTKYTHAQHHGILQVQPGHGELMNASCSLLPCSRQLKSPRRGRSRDRQALAAVDSKNSGVSRKLACVQRSSTGSGRLQPAQDRRQAPPGP